MFQPEIKKYFAMYKPYDVLSQFTDPAGRKTLKQFAKFPKDVYPVGRLDMDSEGLILLTNDKRVTEKLLNSNYRHEREYWVIVEGEPSDEKILELEAGVDIQGEKTLPCRITKIEKPSIIADRKPPIRVFPNQKVSWLSISLIEGRNRQVRKMTAKIGHPTLRLIRWRICNLTLGNLKPGEIRVVANDELTSLLETLSLQPF